MSRSDRRGFSLIEMLIVIVVIGMIALVALPRSQAAFRKAQLRSARNAVINLYQQARTRAINENRRMTLNLDGTSVWVTAQPRRTVGGAGDRDTVGSIHNMTTQYGVALSGGTVYTVDARGLGTVPGAPTKILFTKSGVSDSFTITGYGGINK